MAVEEEEEKREGGKQEEKEKRSTEAKTGLSIVAHECVGIVRHLLRETDELINGAESVEEEKNTIAKRREHTLVCFPFLSDKIVLKFSRAICVTCDIQSCSYLS